MSQELAGRSYFCPSNMCPVLCSYSNLILTDSERRIEACARQISSEMSSKRSMRTGQLYELPPEQSGHVPSESEAFLEWRSNVEECRGEGQSAIGLASAMSKSYRVCSPSQKA